MVVSSTKQIETDWLLCHLANYVEQKREESSEWDYDANDAFKRRIDHPGRATHLRPQVSDDGIVLAVVPIGSGAFLVQELKDLDLQCAVGLLQAPHGLQVVGQAVVEMLHGGLLVAHGERPGVGSQGLEVVAPAAAQNAGHTAAHTAANPATVGRGTGDPDPAAAGSPCHAVSVPQGPSGTLVATGPLHVELHRRSWDLGSGSDGGWEEADLGWLATAKRERVSARGVKDFIYSTWRRLVLPVIPPCLYNCRTFALSHCLARPNKLKVGKSLLSGE